jgi:hypothetical protein
LDEELDWQYIYKVTASYYVDEGQESIDPVVFFKILLAKYPTYQQAININI